MDTMKLFELAHLLDGRVVGDGALEVVRPIHPAEAESASDLALLMDKRLLPLLATTKARTAVVTEGMEIPEGALDGYVVIGRPRLAMAGITEAFERPVHRMPGIHPMAVISAEATLGPDVSIGPFVVIGPGASIGDRTVILSHVSVGAGAQVGADCLFHPGARIGDRVVIGARVIIHHNASIGADGFSYVTPEPGSVESAKATGQVGATNKILRRINSLGAVVLGDDSEVGANSSIDRGTISDTRVGRNTKIDSMVQIGHNVQIGENCLLCGLVGIAGSSKIGDRVVLAGQVGIGDNVSIGSDSVIAAKSGVGSDVPPRSVMFGIPAMPKDRAFSQIKSLARLKTLFADVAALKAKLNKGEE